MKSTYTYALMEVSSPVFDEVRSKLVEAGYQQAIHAADSRDGEVLDMHGIALCKEKADTVIPHEPTIALIAEMIEWDWRTTGHCNPATIARNLDFNLKRYQQHLRDLALTE